MPIKGDLSRIDLANIFQMLTLNQNEGTLHIYFGGMHKSIYFTGTDIILPFDQDTMEDRVLSLLIRQSKLTEEQVERAKYNTGTLNTGLLGALVQMRYVPEEDIHDAFISQMEEDVYELFLLRDAQFEFLEGEKPSDKHTMDYRYTLSPNNLLMEAVRRGDEWAHILKLVPSGVEVFEVIHPSLPEGVEDESGDYALILGAMDGVRSIHRIIEHTRLHRFTVFKCCSVLLENGHIAPLRVDDLVKRGDECYEASRTWDAVDLYERAIEAGLRSPGLFEKAGFAYKSVSENKKAVEHFYSLCDLYEEKGALKQAIRIYLLIRELMPTELLARERIFRLYLNSRELFEEIRYNLLGEGTELALIFKEIGRHENALEVVHLLFDIYQTDNETLEELVKLALELHSSATALMVLEHLGDRLLREKDTGNALRVYRRIKCIDPEYRGIDDKLDRLIVDDLERRKRRGRIVRTSLLVGALIALFAGYFFFNSCAFDAYTAINYDDLMAEQNFESARESYEAFCARFPMSIYWFLARERLGSIDRAKESFSKAMTLQVQYDREERMAAQILAENLYADALVCIEDQDLDAGLRLLRKSAASATDPVWLAKVGASRRLESLEAYFAEAQSLKEQADGLLAAGRFAEAHGLFIRLVLDYGEAALSKSVTLPLLVKSSPPGAKVLLPDAPNTGESQERTPLTPAVVMVPPFHAVEIVLEKEGFVTERKVIDAFTQTEVSFELLCSPERSFPLGEGLSAPPVILEGRCLAAYKNGRIKLFLNDSQEFKWAHTIKALHSLAGPPSVSGDRVFYCREDGTLTALDLETGEMLWERSLPSAARHQIIESKGSLYAALESGILVLLDPENGDSLFEVPLRSAPALDPVPWNRGALVFLQKGSILWIDGTAGKVVEERKISSAPTAVCRMGDELVVGNARGGIDCFHMDRFELGFSFTVPTGESVMQMLPRERRISVLLASGRVIALDTTRLQITGEFMGPAEELWLGPAGASSIAAGCGDGALFLLRISDLSVIRRFRGGGPVEFPGQAVGGIVYFYTRDGNLNGIRF